MNHEVDEDDMKWNRDLQIKGSNLSIKWLIQLVFPLFFFFVIPSNVNVDIIRDGTNGAKTKDFSVTHKANFLRVFRRKTDWSSRAMKMDRCRYGVSENSSQVKWSQWNSKKFGRFWKQIDCNISYFLLYLFSFLHRQLSSKTPLTAKFRTMDVCCGEI